MRRPLLALSFLLFLAFSRTITATPAPAVEIKPDPKVLDRLGPPVTVGDYTIRLPPDYRTAPRGNATRSWFGPDFNLFQILIRPKKDRDASEPAVARSELRPPAGRRDFVVSPDGTSKLVRIDGIPFLLVHTDSRVTYAGYDGDTFISIWFDHPVGARPKAMEIAQAAVTTFAHDRPKDEQDASKQEEVEQHALAELMPNLKQVRECAETMRQAIDDQKPGRQEDRRAAVQLQKLAEELPALPKGVPEQTYSLFQSLKDQGASSAQVYRNALRQQDRLPRGQFASPLWKPIKKTLTEVIGAADDVIARDKELNDRHPPATQPVYTTTRPSRDGIGKVYMGREIAHVMSHEGADWLERPDREHEEAPSKAIALMGLKPTDVVADIGAGTGYFSFRIAGFVPKGKVFAEDIDDKMIDDLKAAIRRDGVKNVLPVLGTDQDVKLPEAGVDVVIMVDAYHEFDHPREMMESIVKALKPGGRVIDLEYRAEDPNVPILPHHKMTEAQAKKEMAAVGLDHVKTIEDLPQQHFMVFRKPQKGAARVR